MKNRKIINPSKLKFTPFNSYGKPISGMSWHKISYNQNTGVGSYVLKMAPGARSLKHKHQNYEEFYVLDGELTDEDNTTCLLYTSPSPRDRSSSRMPSSA